jgi:hypothetical protein
MILHYYFTYFHQLGNAVCEHAIALVVTRTVLLYSLCC